MKNLNEPKIKPENPQAMLNGVGKAMASALETLAETLPQIMEALDDISVSVRVLALLQKYKVKEQLSPVELQELEELEGSDDDEPEQEGSERVDA